MWVLGIVLWLSYSLKKKKTLVIPGYLLNPLVGALY